MRCQLVSHRHGLLVSVDVEIAFMVVGMVRVGIESELRELVVVELNVSEPRDDFEHFAAGWEHPPGAVFVFVHRLHELDFVVGVIPFAGRRIDVSAALILATRSGVPTARIAVAIDATILTTTVHRDCCSGS